MIEVVRWLEPRLRVPKPVLLGLAGSVAAGKSTAAAQLAEHWRGAGKTVTVVSTDGFLLPNAVLEERGLLARKGFPESYDTAAITAFLDALRSGQPALIPVYSHRTYDIVAGERQPVALSDIVLVEGIIALQPALIGGALDLRLYLDADETDLRRWYGERLWRLRDEARSDPDSYFTRFLALSDDTFAERIERIWQETNLPNLREHIAPTRAFADLVLEKAPDHSIRGLHPR